MGAWHIRRMQTEAERTPKACPLQDAAGRVEACPGVGCPFWEEGGVVLEGGCAIQRLALDLALRPQLVQSLLEIRLQLDRARRRGALTRTLFYRLGS